MYMQQRDVKRVGFLVVSTDRGLCGGLNINLFKRAIMAMKDWNAAGLQIDLTLIGTKANSFFKRMGGNIVSTATHLGDKPSIIELIGTVKVMLNAYESGEIDAICVVFNAFVNTMTQHPTIRQLVPIIAEEVEPQRHHWDYIYEPDARAVLDQLLARYIESLVYQVVVENVACEQAARMVAMKSASDNAGNLIDELQLVYNKARQGAITQEIAEIVGGAAAV